jgi:hypothetical protein
MYAARADVGRVIPCQGSYGSVYLYFCVSLEKRHLLITVM